MSAKKWRCFFCDDVFTNRKDAYNHFGEQDCHADVPACVDPLRSDEKKRMDEVREARQYGQRCQEEANDATEKLSFAQDDLERIYKAAGTDNAWAAADRFKNLDFEVKYLRERLALFSDLTPATPEPAKTSESSVARNPKSS